MGSFSVILCLSICSVYLELVPYIGNQLRSPFLRSIRICWYDTLFEFGIAADCPKGYLPELLFRVPSPPERFQPVSQRGFAVDDDQVDHISVPILIDGTERLFPDYQLHRFQAETSFCVGSVADTEKGVAVLLHQTLGPFLARFQMVSAFISFSMSPPNANSRDCRLSRQRGC